MPVRGSRRGSRDSPASTTTRTPGTVTDDSARSVASTTVRRPAGVGRSAASCSAGGSEPCSGADVDVAGHLQLRGDPADLAHPGQEHQDVAGVLGEGLLDGSGHVGGERGDRVAGLVDDLDRVQPPVGGHDRRVVEQRRHPRPVEGGRHHHEPEVVTQRRAASQ